jgi:archaellum component FlaF (FlaF/FlaG flagellin family)
VDVFVRDIVAGTTTRVSVASDGAQANGSCYEPSISADGRYVAFESLASNLVPGDTNAVPGDPWTGLDVFVRDTVAGTTTRVSVASDGTEANGDTGEPSISGDGRYVAFESWASNLVPGDTNERYDVFVRGPLFAAATPPYTMPEAALALQVAGGGVDASPYASRLDIVATGASAGRIDIADALRIARKAAGLEPNP